MSDKLLTVADLMQRWQVSRGSVERAGVQRTVIKGAPRAVRFHPQDVEAHEQRDKIQARVTRAHIAALGSGLTLLAIHGLLTDQLTELDGVLSQIVGEE